MCNHRARFGLPEPPQSTRQPPRAPDDPHTDQAEGETGISQSRPLRSAVLASRVPASSGVGTKAGAGPSHSKVTGSIPVPKPRMVLRARAAPEKEPAVAKDGKPLWR